MKLFRERLLARLIERHAISQDLDRKFFAWRHPGFSAPRVQFKRNSDHDFEAEIDLMNPDQKTELLVSPALLSRLCQPCT